MSAEAQHFESWGIVAGFEGLYEVSNCGRVRRVGRAARSGRGRGGGARIGRILAPLTNTCGRLKAQLWKDGKMHPRLIHRLVAEAFIGPCPPGIEVNHIDGVKTNNHVSNLEYVTPSENVAHAHRTGLQPSRSGANNPRAKLTAERAADLRRRYAEGGVTLRALAKECGVDHKTVQRAITGSTWSTQQ